MKMLAGMTLAALHLMVGLVGAGAIFIVLTDNDMEWLLIALILVYVVCSVVKYEIQIKQSTKIRQDYK